MLRTFPSLGFVFPKPESAVFSNNNYYEINIIKNKSENHKISNIRMTARHSELLITVFYKTDS
jgi:hypothetical protein